MRLSKHMSYEEAACLPCAAVTAWQAVMNVIGARSATSLLVQGSGDVSVFALQLAKAAGAAVIATSSTNEKCKKLRARGADRAISCVDNPELGKVSQTMHRWARRGLSCRGWWTGYTDPINRGLPDGRRNCHDRRVDWLARGSTDCRLLQGKSAHDGYNRGLRAASGGAGASNRNCTSQARARQCLPAR